MGKRREPTPEEGLEEWAKRMSKEEGGISASIHRETWGEFVKKNILTKRGYEPSPAQYEGLERARVSVFESLPEFGFQFERHVTRRAKRYIYRHQKTGVITPYRYIEASRRMHPEYRFEFQRRPWGMQPSYRHQKTGRLYMVTRKPAEFHSSMRTKFPTYFPY